MLCCVLESWCTFVHRKKSEKCVCLYGQITTSVNFVRILKIWTFTFASLAFSFFKTNFHVKLEKHLLSLCRWNTCIENQVVLAAVCHGLDHGHVGWIS